MSSARLFISLSSIALIAACSDSSTPSEPNPPAFDGSVTEVQVDASATTAFIQLGDTIKAVSVASAGSSDAWDISVMATTVALNSGPTGPGSVGGFCICNNEGVTNSAIQTLSPASELPAFLAVSASAIPADDQFLTESLNTRVAGWYTGSGQSAVANPARTFVIMRSRVSPAPAYGKFRITGITGATSTSPGSVTFEYAMQTASTEPLPESRTATVTVGASPVYFDLAAGAVSSAAGTWDIQFDGFLIRANSGASGASGHLVAPPQDVPFQTLDLAALRALPGSSFGQDALGGPFGARPWYKYNVTGSDNQIWPNFNVYLVKKGSTVYKVQITGYYDVNGKARVVSVRSARLR